MSTTQHSQHAAAVGAPDATIQSPVVTPNQYHLSGHGMSVSYFPDGFGSIPKDGPDQLFYQDANRHLVFNGSEISKIKVPDLGTILSITIVRTVDVGGTTFSLILPDVNLPQGPIPPPQSIPKASRRCTGRLSYSSATRRWKRIPSRASPGPRATAFCRCRIADHRVACGHDA